MAAIKGNPEELWTLFLVIKKIKFEITQECDTINRSLEVLKERLIEKEKEILTEIDDLEAEVKKREDMKEGNPLVEMEAIKEDIQKRIRAREDEFYEVKRNHKKTNSCQEQLRVDKKRCLNSLERGSQRVNRYIKILEKLLFEEDFQEYRVLAANPIPGDHKKRYRTMSFRGNTFYCNAAMNTEEKDGQGRTNLVRMEQGLAPIGSDGLPVNLHHMVQNESGSIIELNHTIHSQNHKQLHVNTHNIPSGIDRSAFDILRSAYWRRRAAFIKRVQEIEEKNEQNF